MDYLYENLGDERFQEFCSCLVSKEFPNIQAFPVGQPDGGRDSLVYFMDKSDKEFIIFQVKFMRNPNKQMDPHKWLTETIAGEVKKINKLIPAGAKSYYLLTNVRGTAHLDVGSKDKLNKILEENITIPSICWWRDDLSVLFEKDPIFKWSFPEILNGQDILNSALFNNINENKERRENVIKAYLADQYSLDNEVKFRQIDLQNRLFDLFTDVPIKIKKFNKKNKTFKQTLNILNLRTYNEDEFYYVDKFENVGAVDFLLNSRVQNNIKKILLEGGPGQGKSTISQYICQVHRAKLLDKKQDLEKIPSHLKNIPIRLPFKIDLRHVASWVEKTNPYKEDLSEEYFSNIWAKSLESFLVGHIFYHSKVDNFTSSDLVAIFKLSSVLIVFDGFDEIANLDVRKEVIDFINKGVNRLSESSKSVQIIVTSRPAAFSDSIGFSVDQYPHFELGDITTDIIKDYVEKWIKASRLNSRESSEIKRLVDEKLRLPHLRELAKSPMQLAIFISLLRTRGESLPNKRTALYDSYIELFFNRESEKNTIIRDYRDLIIDIHKYLGWVLHSDSELFKTNGTIHIEDLKKLLNKYLLKEGHQTDITDKLFKAVEERVCALVSRVQGSFEFEVQPLREYFCAKYLYQTAPYSPAGAERTGTKPDRFEAISRNFYWQNVMRFFAGCFDKGELPMLIQKLTELQKDSILQYTNYPRTITSQLLSDYVFTQYPLYLKDAVKIIVDGINIGAILDQNAHSSNTEPIFLPIECGRIEVINECFAQLKTFPANDYAYELIGIIVNNPYHTLEFWKEYCESIKGPQLTTWLEYAYHLEIIHKIEKEFLVEIINDDSSEKTNRLQIILKGNRMDVIENMPILKEYTFQAILDSKLSVIIPRNKNHSFSFLTTILHPFFLEQIIHDKENKNSSLTGYIDSVFQPRIMRRGNSLKNKITEFKVNDSIDRNIKAFMIKIENTISNDLFWQNSIKPWDDLVEHGRTLFNDCWALNLVAVISAGIKSKDDKFENYDDLSNAQLSLCKRVRCARMKSGNVKYWTKQILESNNIGFTLLVFFTWATPKTICQLFSILNTKLESLQPEEVDQIIEGLNKVSCISSFTLSHQRYFKDFIEANDISDLLKYLVSIRFPSKYKFKFIYEKIGGYGGNIQELLKLKLKYLISIFPYNMSDHALLEEIKVIYLKISNSSDDFYHFQRYFQRTQKMPLDTAKIIMADCKNYPRSISSSAELACRSDAHKQIKPVGKISADDKWFA